MFNYYFDTERELHLSTVALFDAIKNGKYEGYTSGYVILELEDAPEPKRTDMLNLIDKFQIKTIEYNENAENLADTYIKYGMIPEKKRLDSLHIAYASISNMDYILSLNFKHINKIKTKQMLEPINLGEGYKGVTICSPMEVEDYDPDE
jgi:hypothetical protein